MNTIRIRAFGLDLPSRAMTANDNWHAPETLSVEIDVWLQWRAHRTRRSA